ncbi:hypothetical protein [Paenibacillus sp. Cedars]|uniref:hypothetical protein n=1 Tax=Paenibacillus sp. Cedars TaxID=1980674 RepID=UPI001164AE22|nr:hypothetical protein [Paenibacillus sp. Cedars]AWP30730.1 hypothetical protein B9D94_30775 [Paenibacillus sp. Cedars]
MDTNLAIPLDINIVSIDPAMNEQQRNTALKLLAESNQRRPITGPVAIQLSENGGIVINEGNIVTMSPKEVADRFKARLKNGDPEALRFNQILCEGGNNEVPVDS